MSNEALTAATIDAALALKPNHALFLPEETVVARSSSGRLWWGGLQGQTWYRSDAEQMLRDWLPLSLDRRQRGHYAVSFRDALRDPARLRPVEVENVGRKTFSVVYEPTETAFFALMDLQNCEWFEWEGRPYGACEAWTAEGKHLWVTPTGQIREMDTVR